MDIYLVILVKFSMCIALSVPVYSVLPRDWTPRSVKDLQDVRVFSGNGAGNRFRRLLDLQDVKVINDEWALVTSRNFIFVIDLKTIEASDQYVEYSQVVQWLPENATTCSYKFGHQGKCNNFIRVIEQISSDYFLVCGTNAMLPKCREYKWNGTQFSGFHDGARYSDTNKCPLDDEPSLTYLYSGGNLYTATKLGYRRDASIRRTPVNGNMPLADFGPKLRSSGVAVSRKESLPEITTDNNDETVLSDPVFISSIETSDKIFVFFREIAMEQFGNGELVYSRVAQVCKNDRGGNVNFRSHKWTSYFKARLNCSFPGNRPFYFDELRHVTKAIDMNGETVVFATMSTPENSIAGSAICGFRVSSIEKALRGDFMKRTSFDASSVCWSKLGQNAPAGHPSICPTEEEDTRRLLSKEDLKFRVNHPLMELSVQPITDEPLFMRTQARYTFTALDAEVDVAYDSSGRSISIFYIGTNDGRLLKVVPYPFDTDDRYDSNKIRGEGAFTEEWLVYDASKCKGTTGKSFVPNDDPLQDQIADEEKAKRILRVTAVAGRDILLVAFRFCVIAVKKKLCSHHFCRKDCVQSGNPYCGWFEGTCVSVTPENRGKIEQDLFKNNKGLPECENGNSSTASTDVVLNGCSATCSFAVPLAISMSACFIVTLVVFFVVTKCQKRLSGRSKRKAHGFQSNFTNVCLAETEGNRKQSSIYKGPRTGTGAPKSLAMNKQQPFMVQTPGHSLQDTSAAATLDEDRTQGPEMHAALESSGSSFSKSSASSPGVESADSESERRKFHGVQIIEGVRDPNFNNNNMRKNFGFVNSIACNVTPVRRRSITNRDKEAARDISTPCTTQIRMGSLSGTTADSCTSPNNKFWKRQNPRIVTNPNFMPCQGKFARTQSENSGNQSGRRTTNNRRISSILPEPPVSGLINNSPQIVPMVSTYTYRSSSENHNFEQASLPPNHCYSEVGAEPEYENVTNENIMVPTPPPPNAKPTRKLSSFTTSHFNTSWFPGTITKDENNGMNKNNPEATSSSDVLSASHSSNSSASLQDNLVQNKIKGEFGKMNVTERMESVKKYRLSDEGYGSGKFSSGSEGRISSSNHDSFTGKNPNIPQQNDVIDERCAEDSIYLEPTIQFSVGDEAPRNLDEGIRRTHSGKKTGRRKGKSSRKSKKNKNYDVPGNLSSSDNDNVFTDLVCFQENVETPHNRHQPPVSKFSVVPNSGYTMDDSYVNCERQHNTGEDYVAKQPHQYAFHTMRPPGRMRHKLPRLRCGENESEATLIAVPTPEIPLK